MIGIIIQARLGSTRLPGKVLKKIGNKTLLEHIMYRLEKLESESQVIIATSVEKKDDELALFCERNSFMCFRGSENNVLERYYLCAKKYKFKDIVRLTADNPFVDIEELDRLIDCYKNTNADYAKSFETLPCGVGAEIFSFTALEKDFDNASMPHHFEHVNEYVLEHPELFKIVTLQTIKEKRRPEIRLTVDTDDDYKRACYIVNNCKEDYISTQKAIQLALKYNQINKEQVDKEKSGDMSN